MAEGRPNALRGRPLKAAGLLLLFGAFVIILATPTSQPLLSEVVELLSGLALIPLGFFVFRTGVQSTRNLRMDAAVGAQDELARDPRAPVLYLRSFKHDSTAARVEYFDNHSDEEQLSAVLRRIGPVVAVGDPSERRVTLGASRIYLSNDEWRDWVESQMAAAALVIFRASDTDAFLWEVATASSQLPPEKTAFLLPRDPLLYENFRQKFSEQLDRALPASLPPITRSKAVEAPIPPDIWGLMYFNHSGQPVFKSWLSAEKLYTFAGIVGCLGVTLGRHAVRTKQSGYVYLLRPVLNRTGASTGYVPTPFGVMLLLIGLFTTFPYLLARSTIRGLSGRTARLLPGWHEDDTYAFRLTSAGHDSTAARECEAPLGRQPSLRAIRSRKRAVIAGTLQLFLGTVGAGRFYIGSTLIGSCQLGMTALSFLVATISNHAYSTEAVALIFGVTLWAFVDAILMFGKALAMDESA